MNGIKSVDFQIEASGYGVVNWNGTTTVEANIDGRRKPLNNHTMPKLRGYSNLETATTAEGVTYPRYKLANQIDFEKTPLYISQNCIRHHLFKQEDIDYQNPEVANNVIKVLCSMTGLLRGYVIPTIELNRTGPLFITDFVDSKNQGNYEQFGRAGSKEKKKNKAGSESSNAIFSKTTFGETEYTAYGSISIEELQFIPTSKIYGQAALEITTEAEGRKAAKEIEDYIKTLEYAKGDIKAEFHTNWIRKGTVFKQGQSGILLSEDAIDALVKQMLHMLRNLGFTQAKGYMSVDKVSVDYNDSDDATDMFRIKKGADINQNKEQPYTIYYERGE